MSEMWCKMSPPGYYYYARRKNAVEDASDFKVEIAETLKTFLC